MHLYSGKKKQKYLLSTCPKDSLLHAIGIRQGLEVTVVSKQPMGGPIVIRIMERDIAIDKSLAIAITAKAVI